MLEKERTEIDRLDREIVKLFEERTKMVEQVAEVKLANNKDILDAGREALVIEKVQEYLENPELKEELAGYTGMLNADITVTENGEVVYRKTKGVYYPIKNYYKIV